MWRSEMCFRRSPDCGRVEKVFGKRRVKSEATPNDAISVHIDGVEIPGTIANEQKVALRAFLDPEAWGEIAVRKITYRLRDIVGAPVLVGDALLTLKRNARDPTASNQATFWVERRGMGAP